MDTITITAPAPADPALASFMAKVEATAGTLDCSPAILAARIDDRGRRTAVLTFDTVDQLIAWVAWLHWPWASHVDDGQRTVRALGQWNGYACELHASEPLQPLPAEL